MSLSKPYYAFLRIKWLVVTVTDWHRQIFLYTNFTMYISSAGSFF